MEDAILAHLESARELLLAAPVIDVNRSDTDGMTALARASENGHYVVVELLLAAPGIDVNRADKWGETPLMRVSRRETWGTERLKLHSFQPSFVISGRMVVFVMVVVKVQLAGQRRQGD